MVLISIDANLINCHLNYFLRKILCPIILYYHNIVSIIYVNKWPKIGISVLNNSITRIVFYEFSDEKNLANL